MMSMTTTSAPFREADVLRDTAGKFSGKGQSAPELTLGDDFDLAAFMQEPPTVAEPFTPMQPVIYREANGEDVHASFVGTEDSGFVRIVERTPGTLGDTEDEVRIVDGRYLREDLDISVDTLRRQARGLDSATAFAREIAQRPASMLRGFDQYADALHVRDQLKVGGRTDHVEVNQAARRAVDNSVDDLARRDLAHRTTISWLYLDSDPDQPAEFRKAEDAVGDSYEHLRAGLQAKFLTEFGDIADIGEGHVDIALDAINDACDLGERMDAAVLAADSVDADTDAIGAERAAAIFPAHVNGLSQRKKVAYRRAVGIVSEAFETLERYGLLDDAHRTYGRASTSPASEEAILVRAAAQAAILRHYQPETGVTDAQLDAISAVWDGALAAHSKAAA